MGARVSKNELRGSDIISPMLHARAEVGGGVSAFWTESEWIYTEEGRRYAVTARCTCGKAFQELDSSDFYDLEMMDKSNKRLAKHLKRGFDNRPGDYVAPDE